MRTTDEHSSASSSNKVHPTEDTPAHAMLREAVVEQAGLLPLAPAASHFDGVAP
jgi:hypothetical protein